jgi:acyl carrier protein
MCEKCKKRNPVTITSSQTETFEDALAELETPKRISHFIATSIGNKLCSLLVIDTSDINLERSISDFGIDSLLAIELRKWIMREFNAPLQITELMDG